MVSSTRSSSGYKGQWFLVAAVILTAIMIETGLVAFEISKARISSEWDDPDFYFYMALRNSLLDVLVKTADTDSETRYYAGFLAEVLGNETGRYIDVSYDRFRNGYTIQYISPRHNITETIRAS